MSSNSIHSGVKLENYVAMVKVELGVNQTLGGSNISSGLPDRNLINSAFLAIALEAGVTCPIVDVAKVRLSILAADPVLGRDKYMRAILKPTGNAISDGNRQNRT